MIKICNTAEETKSFAAKLANEIPSGSVVALIGDLGSGKTTFSQGYAKALNVQENVGSPTFKLVSEYWGRPHNFFHVDCYRLRGTKDFLNIGGEKYLYPKGAVTLIEWADLIDKLLSKSVISINFERIESKPDERKLTINGWK
tara:strand:+ start:998 stop:1426 length:429 start_codon:yes stop_codon:yes gene_type:complete